MRDFRRFPPPYQSTRPKNYWHAVNQHPSQTTTCKFCKILAHNTLLSPWALRHHPSIQTKNSQQTQTRSRTEKTACKCFPHRLESKPFFVSAIYAVLSANALSALSTNFLTVFMRQNNLIFDTPKDRERSSVIPGGRHRRLN